MFVIIVVCCLGTLRTDSQRSVAHRSFDVDIAATTATAVMVVVTGWSGSKTSCSKGSRLLSFLTEKRLRCVSLHRPTAQYTHTHTHSLVFIYSHHTLPRCIALCYTSESRKLVCILCCVFESSIRTTRPNWRIPFCPDVPATSTTMEVDHWLTIIC